MRAEFLPPPTCPTIDQIIGLLEKLRLDNSQLRMGVLHYEELYRECVSEHLGGLDERLKSPGLNPGTAKSSREFESHTLRQSVIEAAIDLVALWKAQKISGLLRSERNAAIDDTRSRLISAVENLK